MTVIFDNLRVRLSDHAVAEAGPNASIDKLRHAVAEIGNKPYFDADPRLNKNKIENKFKPLSHGMASEMQLLDDYIIVQQLIAELSLFNNAFPTLRKQFAENLRGQHIFDLVHTTSHTIGIGHTPREEILTFLAETAMYGSDATKHLFAGTYNSVPPLSDFDIRGLKNDFLPYSEIHSHSSNCGRFYMLEAGYINRENVDYSFQKPIIDGANPSPVQITFNEILEVTAASKYVASRVENTLKTPLPNIKLLELPTLPAKLFTLNDEDRDIIFAMVYPEHTNPNQAHTVKSDHRHIIDHLDRLKRSREQFENERS